MKVYIVLEDLGNYDGGATISAVFADKEKAQAFLDECKAANRHNFPEWIMQEHEVIGYLGEL